MTGITMNVHGIPAPQGSKRHVGNGVMIESSAKVKPWREAVKAMAIDVKGDDWQPLNGPVQLEVTFYFPRPQSHYGTGRNATTLKASAPVHHSSVPDLSKLIRSTEDALTEAGIWRDDSRVTRIRASKIYSTSFTGAVITVREALP